MSKMDPITEGVILECANSGVDMKYVPVVKNLVFAQNPVLKKANDLIIQGKI